MNETRDWGINRLGGVGIEPLAQSIEEPCDEEVAHKIEDLKASKTTKV